jgi:hypothetical protein
VKHLARLALGLSISTLVPGVAVSATWTVSPDGPIRDIQAAIDVAAPGDVVLIHPGTYHEQLVLRDRIHLTAQIAGTVVVDAEAEGSAVTAVGIGATTTITGLVFRNGSADSGGGLFAVATNANFTDCVFESCGAVLGGGAYLRDGSHAVFLRCTFANNQSSVGAGLYLDFAGVTLTSCTVLGNWARDGAAIATNNGAEAIVSYTEVYANVATQGAALACNDASPRFTNCTVVANTCNLGAFAFRGSGTRIERCIVAQNAGPAIGCSGSNSPWVGCSIFYGNASENICSGDMGDNRITDPFFCRPESFDYRVAANSPAVGGPCQQIGALPVGCPAHGAEQAVQEATWAEIKSRYRD